MEMKSIYNAIDSKLSKFKNDIKKLYKFDVTTQLDIEGNMIITFDGKDDHKTEQVKNYFGSSVKFNTSDYDDYLNITMVAFNI